VAGAPQSQDNGTHQNIARAASAMHELAASGNDGLRLTDVADRTGMSKTAAHRCLAGLVAHGLAAQDGESGRYFIGDRILAWAGMAEERFELAQRIKPYLRRLADELHDTLYFSVRRGDDSVCYGRAEGSFPIKTLTLQVGDHRPLGVGSGSMAILAFLDPPEVERILRDHARDRAPYPLTDETLRDKLAQTRAAGHSMMEGYLVQGITGMGGIGVPVLDPGGRCIASISLAAISERIPAARIPALVTRLRAEAAVVTSDLGELLTRL
jgi:DNA-binding IclR family transcriptional regulator